MVDPGFPVGERGPVVGGGDADLRHGRFSVDIYAKTYGGGAGCSGGSGGALPGSANEFTLAKVEDDPDLLGRYSNDNRNISGESVFFVGK